MIQERSEEWKWCIHVMAYNGVNFSTFSFTVIETSFSRAELAFLKCYFTICFSYSYL